MIFPLGCIRAVAFLARLARMGPHLPLKSNMPAGKFFPKGQNLKLTTVKSADPLEALQYRGSKNQSVSAR